MFPNIIVDKFSNVVIYGITRSEYIQFLGLSNMTSMEKEKLLALLGKRIKEVRLEKGMSQVDLVAKMRGNIDTTNISRIEAGRTNPTIYSLYRLSRALDMSIGELVNFDTKK
jgi:ribosome-binding protein aMBF1 (putative translation factor)